MSETHPSTHPPTHPPYNGHYIFWFGDGHPKILLAFGKVSGARATRLAFDATQPRAVPTGVGAAFVLA